MKPTVNDLLELIVRANESIEDQDIRNFLKPYILKLESGNMLESFELIRVIEAINIQLEEYKAEDKYIEDLNVSTSKIVEDATNGLNDLASTLYIASSKEE